MHLLPLLLDFKSIQEFGCEISFDEVLISHQLLMEWNGCLYSFNDILTQGPAHGIDGLFAGSGNCNDFCNH